MNSNRIIQTILSLLIICMALPVQAHTGHAESASLQLGFVHPWTGIDHLLALLAVAAWTVRDGSLPRWVMPVLFSVGLMVGSLLVLAGSTLPGAESAIVLSVMLLGGFIYFNPRILPLLAGLLVVGFALFHGYAHTSEAAAETVPGAYLAGILAGSLLILIGGIVIALLIRRAHSASLRWSGVGFSFAGLLLMMGV